ncbi:MAG: hypothetical protein Q9168_003514 [Polycauliona sp. 1 TL-2023]
MKIGEKNIQLTSVGKKDVTPPDASSDDSEQPPYSVNYDPTAEQMATIRPLDIQPKSYDVDVELDPEFDDVYLEDLLDTAAFLRTHHGYEEGWVGRRLLGKGAGGRAGLWEKLDSNGGIIDQICIKQIGNAQLQNDPQLRKPIEAKIMEDLRDRPNNGSVRLLGYRRYPKILAHRLYMEFCRHGEIYRLIKNYRKQKQYFPEEFIWDVFHHLLNAVKAMDSGPLKPKYPHLTTYVHRDIKPQNIFLADPQRYDDGGIPIYPTAKLGDFGLAIITGEDDPHNPWALKRFGTHGYQAPEQKYSEEDFDAMSVSAKERAELQDYAPTGVTQDWPHLGTHTNIWEVGACMYELMVLTQVSYDLVKAHNEGSVLGKIRTHRTPEYSRSLTDLVHQCLKIDPNRRPTLQKLESIIDSQRSMFRDRWARGQTIPNGAAVLLDPDQISRMAVGPFVKGPHIKFDLDEDTIDEES